jgi:hypothetical protein
MNEQQQRTITIWTMPMCMSFPHALVEQCGNGRCPLHTPRVNKL